MSTIYLICGILGWGVCPIVFLAYGWMGRRQARGFDVEPDRH